MECEKWRYGRGAASAGCLFRNYGSYDRGDKTEMKVRSLEPTDLMKKAVDLLKVELRWTRYCTVCVVTCRRLCITHDEYYYTNSDLVNRLPFNYSSFPTAIIASITIVFSHIDNLLRHLRSTIVHPAYSPLHLNHLSTLFTKLSLIIRIS